MNHNPIDIFETAWFAVPAGSLLWSILLLRITKPQRDAKRRARRAAQRAN